MITATRTKKRVLEPTVDDKAPITLLVARPSGYRVLDEIKPDVVSEVDTLDGNSGDSDTV